MKLPMDLSLVERTFRVMRLVIAEKPSVARDIAAVLGKVTRNDGYMTAGEYTVTYAVGHLVGLADADAYDTRYKSWRMADLPILPEPFRLVVLEHAKAQYRVVSKLLKQAQEVIVATDAGREGQLIYELIARHAGYKGPAKRLWLSSMTESAIREAFLHLRDNEEFHSLYEAAVSRSEADWMVGINATRCMTVQGGTKLPVGRVQTPTLAMIVERDVAIEQFIPVPYYEVEATFQTPAGVYVGKWTKEKQTRFDDVAIASVIADKVRGQVGRIEKVDTHAKSEQAPQLFDLTALQRKANQRYGMTADHTLKMAQALYETHKVLTYPRTDSRYISQDIVQTLPARLRAGAAFLPSLTPLLDQIKAKPGHRVVNDRKITDHHAIIPTEKPPRSLTGDERKVYELVLRQTFCALLPDAIWSQTIIETVVDDEWFRTFGKTLQSSGWRSALESSTEEESTLKQADDEQVALLPKVERGQMAQVEEAKVLSKQTKAPAHFTEASLLASMESAGKQIDDVELAEAMKERGLGTPATRAATIEKLKRDGMIELQKKQLHATAKGRQLIHAIPSVSLKSAELTGAWEAKLKQMERSQYQRETFIQEIHAFTRDMIGHMTAHALVVTPDHSAQIGVCPLCGAALKESPRAFGCSAWKTGCGFTVWKTISGHRVTVNDVLELVTDGITKPLSFQSKAGKSFQAQLKLVEGKVEFSFMPRK